MDGPPDSWCILRTSGGRTLRLARSLASAGIETWTPVAVMARRKPRSRATREVEAPLMPTFVFARARHLAELVRIRAMPTDQHPPFSIFQLAQRAPLIADTEIAALREEEARLVAIAEKRRRALSRPARKFFEVGQPVRVEEGSFAGMSGVVEESDGKFAMVCFGGRMRFKIGAWHLVPNSLQAASVAITGAAA